MEESYAWKRTRVQAYLRGTIRRFADTCAQMDAIRADLADQLRGIDYSRQPGGKSDGQAVPNAVIRIEQLDEKWNARKAALMESYDTMSMACMPSEPERYAIWLHDVKGMTWEAAALATYTSLSTLHRRLDVAYAELYEYLPTEAR